MFPNISFLCKKTDSAWEHLWAAMLMESTLKSRSEFRILRPSILKSLRGKWTIIDFMRPLGKVQKVWGYIWKLFANKKRCLKLPLQFTEIIGFSRVKMLGVFKVSLEKKKWKMLVHPCSSECSIWQLSLLCTNYREWKRATINKKQIGKCHPVNSTLYPSNSQETFYFWVTMVTATEHFIYWEFLQQREFLHYIFSWHFLTQIFFPL